MRLDGTKVLISGNFEGRTHDELVDALTSRGAQIATEIAPDVEVVFAAADAGGEVDAARELGVRVEDAAGLEAALAGVEPPRKTADAPVRAAAAPTTRAAKPATATADGERAFAKGERVRIIGGREGVGEIGEIFWWGDSKFGEGMRAGVTGADGTKYWVDEAHLAWPDEKVDEEALQEAIEANVFGRGDRIRVKSGNDAGAQGTIFWWGESKWGDGMRAGVETDDGEKLWVDAEHLEATAEEDDVDADIPF